MAGPDNIIDRQIQKYRNRIEKINNEAEKIRPSQPDFASWVAAQNVIHQNMEKAVRFDASNFPDRLSMTLSDWDSLISRMEKEVVVFGQLPNLAELGTVNVMDFGAKGDSKHDDRAAIEAAIQNAVETGKGRVFLPAGKYFLKSKGYSSSENYIFLKNIKNLEIYGENGTVLLNEAAHMGFFKMTDCVNVYITNMHLSALKDAFITGVVTDVNKEDQVLAVRLDPGQTITPEDPSFKTCTEHVMRIVSAGLDEDGKTPKAYCARGPMIHNPVLKKKGDLDYEIIETRDGKINDLAKYEKGIHFIDYARENRIPGFGITNSLRCRLDRISLDSVGGAFSIVEFSDALFVTNCTIKAKDSAKLANATGADGFYSAAGGLGGYFSGNTFANLGDDFINLFTVSSPIEKVDRKRNKIQIPLRLLPERSVSELRYVGFIRPSQGITKDFVDQYAKILDKQIVMGSKADGQAQKMLELTVDKLPAKLEGVFLPDMFSQGQVYIGNKYMDGTSRILSIGSKSLFANNYVRNKLPIYCFMYVAFDNNYDGWWESNYQRYVTYKGNVFDSVHGRFFNMADSAYDPKRKETRAAHFFIQDNHVRFNDDDDSCLSDLLWCRGVEDVEFSGNSFTGGTFARGAAYIFKDCSVVLSENIINGRYDTPRWQSGAELVSTSGTPFIINKEIYKMLPKDGDDKKMILQRTGDFMK